MHGGRQDDGAHPVGKGRHAFDRVRAVNHKLEPLLCDWDPLAASRPVRRLEPTPDRCIDTHALSAAAGARLALRTGHTGVRRLSWDLGVGSGQPGLHERHRQRGIALLVVAGNACIRRDCTRRGER